MDKFQTLLAKIALFSIVTSLSIGFIVILFDTMKKVIKMYNEDYLSLTSLIGYEAVLLGIALALLAGSINVIISINKYIK